MRVGVFEWSLRLTKEYLMRKRFPFEPRAKRYTHSAELGSGTHGASSKRKACFRRAAFWGLVPIVAVAALEPRFAAAQEVDDEVIVTGTRIARDPNVASPIAVQSITADDLTVNGSFNTIDVLNDLPSLSNSTTAETGNQTTDTDDDGQNTLNLRGMGEDRTLVLVNGRRHVAGVEGSQAVDIGTIPPGLIERVEVLTGGASAIYGADAVTGVVNFILKDDFDGLDLTARTGISSESDGDQYAFSGLFGRNFSDGRGNVTIGFDYFRDPGINMGDRNWAANNGIADNDGNPALRFQRGEIDAATTPNFASYYDFDATGLYPFGLPIPTAEDFVDEYTTAFGSAPTLTAAELALIQRGASAPPRAILPFHNFSISSTRGVIAPGDFSVANGIDLDANGVEDCLDSFVGYNSSLDGAASFGILGGCWAMENGQPRPYVDGLVAGDFNGFGGDGIENFFSDDLLIPREDRAAINVTGRFDLGSRVTLFGEAKYVSSEADRGGPLNTFWDLLYGAPDNPFLPAALQSLAVATDGLYITRDLIDMGPNVDTTERRTLRLVAGAEGELGNGWAYEISGNYGEFERELIDRNNLLSDRWFAAIDVISDPVSGQPICRSDIDPTPPPTTVFGIPAWDTGFFTFTPGDGQCRPANIWAGVGGISQEAIDFITTTVVDKSIIQQTVFNAIVTGDAEGLSLPAGGPLSFALGLEWREEKSEARFDPLNLGIIPAGAPFPAGILVETVSDNSNLGFDGGGKVSNATGKYDVYDVFGEVALPILRDKRLAQELTVDAAFRYSDYSTIGGTDTWKLGAVWAPIDAIRVRANRSQAVRAPNIFELFSPDQVEFFRPVDPCGQSEINALATADPVTAATREANCRAAGIPQGFEDPLSARFPGVAGGNSDLLEETADTATLGIVLQPPRLSGFTVSIDYWEMTVENAIVALDEQDIVDNCYDSPTFPNDYCGLFTRNSNPASAQFNGFTFLRQTQLNFGAIEATGVDLAARYTFNAGPHAFTVLAQATKQTKLDYFFDPGDPTAVDPELGELFRPELAGNVSLSWSRGAFAATWAARYLGEQALRDVEIETYRTQYGEAGIADSVYLYDLSARFALSESVRLFGGLQNVTDEKPYITEFSWPTGPRGRFLFVGAEMSF
jgi:outer membrane receptor protein involved in Fe transport